MIPFATVHLCGTVHSVKTETVGAKGFQKATVVVDLGEEEFAHVEAVHGLRHVAEGLTQGDKVNIHAHLRSREWQDKRFHDVRAVSIARVCDEPAREPRGQEAPPRRPAQTKVETPKADPQTHLPEEDDVPF